jgi:uncharacterized membrane protein
MRFRPSSAQEHPAMNIVLWIVTGFLAAVFLGSGITKLIRPQDRLEALGMRWAADMRASTVKGIGLAEVLGAIGMILPGVTGVATFLVPIAATGLVVTMVGAVITHVRRGDGAKAVLPSAVFGLLVLFVAVGRFGPWAL